MSFDHASRCGIRADSVLIAAPTTVQGATLSISASSYLSPDPRNGRPAECRIESGAIPISPRFGRVGEFGAPVDFYALLQAVGGVSGEFLTSLNAASASPDEDVDLVTIFETALTQE